MNHPQQVARRGVDEDTDDRRTTDETFDECRALARVPAFDLDPAANDESARAPSWYTLTDNGLHQPWFGHVWVNPPYSNIESWVVKARVELHRCKTIAMLLPANRTEQGWWQEHVETARRDGSIETFFLARRRRFDRPGWVAPTKGDRPPFGVVLLVWRNEETG